MTQPIVCKDCERTFSSAQEFSDHFERLPRSNMIVGCKKKGE